MKYIKQFAIILFLSFVGVSPSSVKDVSAFLIEAMPIMFIPAAVGLMDSWQTLKTALIPYAIITFVTTCAVMAVSGIVVQVGMRRDPVSWHEVNQNDSKEDRRISLL